MVGNEDKDYSTCLKLIMQNGRCETEIRVRIGVAKAAFN